MVAYIGIDVHQHFCQVALNEDGLIPCETRYENSLDGAASVVNLAGSVDFNVKAVVEPSANYWMKVYDKLENEGLIVELCNPSRTRVVAERLRSGEADHE